MLAYFLVIVLSTSDSGQSGAATIQLQFKTEQACLREGNKYVLDAQRRGNYVLTWGML